MFCFVVVLKGCDCFIICIVHCFKGIFFVAHNITVRNWASLGPLIRDADDDLSLLLTTNILSMAVLQPL